MHTVERVIDWNSKRYEQILNIGCATTLLAEEALELDLAMSMKDDIEILDALGDIMFVAIGTLWKGGCDTHRIIEMLTKVPFGENLASTRAHFITYSIGTIGSSGQITLPYIKVMADAVSLMVHVVDIMNMMGCGKQLLNLVGIICDSNDTKSVPIDKVDPSVKANIDKGEDFIPPTKALQKFKNTYWVTNNEVTIYDN